MKINLKHISPNKIILGLVMMLVFNYGAAQGQPQQGLMSRLIEIKYGTELYLTMELKSDSKSDLKTEKKDSALALYNTMRWKLDGFVYQLSSVLIMQNSPKTFKKLDAWCYTQNNSKLNKESSKLIAQHVASFAEIDALYQNQIAPKLYNQPKTLNLTTNVFYLLKDSYTIIKGLSDLKTRKAMAILELLDHARLLSPMEIGKGGIALFKAGKAQKLVYAGGKMPWDKVKKTEGEVLKEYAISNGVPIEIAY
jgi:hypothetical protein